MEPSSIEYNPQFLLQLLAAEESKYGTMLISNRSVGKRVPIGCILGLFPQNISHAEDEVLQNMYKSAISNEFRSGSITSTSADINMYLALHLLITHGPASTVYAPWNFTTGIIYALGVTATTLRNNLLWHQGGRLDTQLFVNTTTPNLDVEFSRNHDETCRVRNWKDLRIALSDVPSVQQRTFGEIAGLSIGGEPPIQFQFTSDASGTTDRTDRTERDVGADDTEGSVDDLDFFETRDGVDWSTATGGGGGGDGTSRHLVTKDVGVSERHSWRTRTGLAPLDNPPIEVNPEDVTAMDSDDHEPTDSAVPRTSKIESGSVMGGPRNAPSATREVVGDGTAAIKPPPDRVGPLPEPTDSAVPRTSKIESGSVMGGPRNAPSATREVVGDGTAAIKPPPDRVGPLPEPTGSAVPATTSNPAPVGSGPAPAPGPGAAPESTESGYTDPSWMVSGIAKLSALLLALNLGSTAKRLAKTYFSKSQPPNLERVVYALLEEDKSASDLQMGRLLTIVRSYCSDDEVRKHFEALMRDVGIQPLPLLNRINVQVHPMNRTILLNWVVEIEFKLVQTRTGTKEAWRAVLNNIKRFSSEDEAYRCLNEMFGDNFSAKHRTAARKISSGDFPTQAHWLRMHAPPKPKRVHLV